MPSQSIRKDQKEALLDHLNSIHNSIQFTSEDPSEGGSIPFLDLLVFPDEEGRLKTTVYRKPTHTNQYLHWDSHHAILSKYSMIGTLFHRAKTICSGPTQLQEEKEHLYRILKKCKYSTWALNRVKLRNQTPAHKKNNKRNTNPKNNRDQKPHITVPYHQGMSESFKRTCKKYGIEVHLKGGPIIKNPLMTPKDKDPILKRIWVIYRFKCNRMECNENILESQLGILGRGLRNI